MSGSGIGVWVLFGVVLTPLYVMLAGWFLDRPREVRPALIGVGYLVGFTVLMWSGAAAVSFAIGLMYW
jgi:hypothetical protein